MNEKVKKGLALGVMALVGAGIGAGAVALGTEPQTVEVEKLINQTVEVEKIVEVPVEVVKEVEVEVEKLVEVPVDNGNLGIVLEHIYDNDGQVEYLLDDLDDDEVDMIVDRIAFSNDVKTMAVDAVKDDGLDLLDDEMFDGVELDDRDIDRFRVYDDDDEVVIDDIEYEDRDADVIVSVRFEQDDVKYRAFYDVEIKDGKVDDVDLDYIEYR